MNSIETITIRCLTGPAIAEQLEVLASLRLDIFAEYPYLYSGQRDAEMSYLASYAEQSGGCVFLAEENGSVVGAATGMPLRHEGAALSDPVASSWPIGQLYYIGELLFRPAYRSRGHGRRLLTDLEAFVRALGYSKIVCVTVQRPAGHPQCPKDAIPVERFLARTGFACLHGVTTCFRWLEVDGVRRDHIMQFWLKSLDERGIEAPSVVRS